MTDASIPVDLFNPGQVFACLGFLEAADVLLGDAEGGFDWRNESQVRFRLTAAGAENPFATVLKFLTQAKVCRCVPIGYADPPPKKKKKKTTEHNDDEAPANSANLRILESYANREGDRMALSIRLESEQGHSVDLGHWADGSSRNDFKLYAGNRSAYGIACDMLRGKRGKPTKKNPEGKVENKGLIQLWGEHRTELVADPFNVLCAMGGSFNFDSRGAWTALDAGFSPDQQKKAGNIDGIASSPVVEILAAWAMEHARPDEYATRQVRYGAWSGLLPPILARPALAGAMVVVPVRTFRFALILNGKNKVVTFAQEETR
jgi:CRISPR-associated protein Csx14